MDELQSKTFIGVYYNDADLLDKIKELKEFGYLDDNIYVIAKNETDVTMLRSRTGADVYSAYDTWTDRFMGFLTGENHIKQMMFGIGMDTNQVDRYYEEVQHGGMMLYVDEGWAYDVYSNDEAFYTDSVPANPTNLITHLKQTNDPFTEQAPEPSYGGYEPLQNKAYPEVQAAMNENETITTEDITSEADDSVIEDSIIEEDSSDFPRK